MLHYARDTHREYLILITCPLQQWLQDYALMLHYTYIICLVKCLFCGSIGENYLVLHKILFFIFNAEVLLKISGFRIRTITMGVFKGIKETRCKTAQTDLRFALWKRQVW